MHGRKRRRDVPAIASVGRVPGEFIPLPISLAISADQGLTIPTVDCFRKRHRQQIKHLRPQMGSAAGLMGNGMG